MTNKSNIKHIVQKAADAEGKTLEQFVLEHTDPMSNVPPMVQAYNYVRPQVANKHTVNNVSVAMILLITALIFRLLAYVSVSAQGDGLSFFGGIAGFIFAMAFGMLLRGLPTILVLWSSYKGHKYIALGMVLTNVIVVGWDLFWLFGKAVALDHDLTMEESDINYTIIYTIVCIILCLIDIVESKAVAKKNISKQNISDPAVTQNKEVKITLQKQVEVPVQQESVVKPKGYYHIGRLISSMLLFIFFFDYYADPRNKLLVYFHFMFFAVKGIFAIVSFALSLRANKAYRKCNLPDAEAYYANCKRINNIGWTLMGCYFVYYISLLFLYYRGYLT